MLALCDWDNGLQLSALLSVPWLLPQVLAYGPEWDSVLIPRPGWRLPEGSSRKWGVVATFSLARSRQW